MLEDAEAFIRWAPPEDLGCLYYSSKKDRFFLPVDFSNEKDFTLHFGQPGGVLPRILTK